MRFLLLALPLTVLLVSVPGPARSFAAGSPKVLPQLIQIIGSLWTPSEAAERKEQTLNVRIAGERRILYVRTVKSLTSDDHDWSMLRNLGRFLSITGPTPLIDQLQSKESIGLPLKIEGRLYMKERVLMLTSVESAVPQLQ
jgi:hypothetical protein